MFQKLAFALLSPPFANRYHLFSCLSLPFFLSLSPSLSVLVYPSTPPQEAVILDCLLKAVARCPDPAGRHCLKLMSELYALQRIHQDVLLRDDEFLAPPKAKAIRRAISDICLELRPHALPLVAAFDYPDHILRAPIGLQHGTQGEASAMYHDYLREVGFGGSEHP